MLVMFLYILAAVLFLVAAWPVASRWPALPAGLFVLTMALALSHGVGP